MEIESTFHGAHLMMMRQKQQERDMKLDGFIEHSYYDRDMDEIFDADAWDNHVEKNNNKENVNEAVSTAASATVSASLERYMHNPKFELPHMSVLRDYLS